LHERIEEACDPDASNEFKSEALAALYENWAGYIKKLGGKPGVRNSFSDRLAGKGFARIRTKHGSTFRGIRLQPVHNYQGDARSHYPVTRARDMPQIR
jgi:hypothetical protein